ncbi:MAG: hypothetical protein K2P02_00025 [Lachnospiraceae bacterium]|nr:hypothetical protein [Lachnospiraceae bacterium]
MKIQETVKFFGHIITVIFPLEYWRLLLYKNSRTERAVNDSWECVCLLKNRSAQMVKFHLGA